MASPFKVFRKNQKMWIAILGVMTMFAFVFIPFIMQIMGGGKTQTNPFVVKTAKYGNLYAFEMSNLHRQRLHVLGVLSELKAQGMRSDLNAAVKAGKITPQNAARYASLANPAVCRRDFENLFGPAEKGAEVDTWLLAKKAEQMGVVVSREAINDYLQGITQNRIAPADILAILNHAGVSDRQFFEMMREELMALNYQRLILFSLSGKTPAERWDCFLRVKQKATIEAVPVAVSNFVQKVELPKEEELKEFFEKNKEKESLPNSPEPGFHCPQKIVLEYFSASIEKFASPDLITEEDIQKYYAKKNDFYDQLMKKPEDNKKAENEKKDSTKDTKKETDAKEANQVKEEKATPVLKEEKKGEKVEEKKEVEKGKDSIQVEDKKEIEKGTDSKKSSATSKTSPFVLTSLLQEDNKQPEAKTENKPDAKPEAKPDAKPEVKPEAKPEEKSASKPEEKAKETKPGLSDELKKRIREDIAFEKIKTIYDELTKKMIQHGQKMEQYEVKLIQYTAKGTPEKAGPAPAKLDFEALAKQYGLTSGRLGPVSMIETRGSAIGDSFVNGRPVWNEAFKTLKKYKPEMSIDSKDNLHLFWKTEDVKEHVPKLDDPGVRDDVLLTWKMIHSREAALKQVKLLAADARKADKPLKQVFADRPDLHVVLPTPFTWMTMRSTASSQEQYAELSEVAGVEWAGMDFMRTVFRLKAGELGVAMNAPQTVAYVIRLSEFTPPYKELLKDFENDKNLGQYSSTALEDQRQIYRDWLKEIKESAGLEWAEGQNPQQIEPNQSSEPVQDEGD